MSISKIFSIRNWVMKQIMKTNKEGIIKIPDPGKIDFGEMIIKEELFKKGIDPKAITSSKQLDNILNTPTVTPHSTPKKSGEVIEVDFDKGRWWKDIDPEKKAYGGVAGMLGEPTYMDDNHRVPYKDGRGPKMSRRNFLKIMGGLAALPVVGKFFKFGKPFAKTAKVADLTQIPIHNAEGMPSWFKPLVNRVIKEGNDITKLPPHKGGALAEREIVHSAKLGEGQGVRVTQNLDDQTIRVEYQSVDNMGGVDSSVNLNYKAAEEIPIDNEVFKNLPKGKSSVKTKPTFNADEAYPYSDNPFGHRHQKRNITMEGDNTVTKVDDLYSDTSALKQFGTNKALSKKELAIAKQKRKRVNEINNDPNEAEQLLPNPPEPDFASGGRVPLDEGGITSRVPYWKGGSWKAIKEAIKHNKIFGVGGPPYKPGATSFDIKQLTKDRFGTELSLKELKEMVSESNIIPGISPRQFKEAKETLPKFLGGFKEYKADVIKQQLLDSKRFAKIRIKVSKDMLKKNPEDVMTKKISSQMIRDSEKQLKDLDAALKDIDVYKAMKEKTGITSHATGGRVPLSGGGSPTGMSPSHWNSIIEAWDDYDGPMTFSEFFNNYHNKAEGGRVPFFAGSIAKLGKFSKADVLLQMFENTIKQSKSAKDKKMFTNFIKEIKAKPELANDPEVWGFFTKGLPKNQRLVVHSDDTVDFWRQSDFGPHNIETTNKFMQKHPNLSRDEAVRIQNMEPEDQILEMKRLETIADRSRTKNASGGRVPLGKGGGIMKLLELLKSKPTTLKEFLERRQFIKNMVGNTPENEKARILADLKKATEEARKNPGFKFPESGVGSDIHKEIEMILSKDVTKHAEGGVAGMLGE